MIAQNNEPQEIKVHQNILYISPFLYINEVDGKQGNSLLFMFLMSRNKDESNKTNIAQKFISFTPQDGNYSNLILTSYFDNLDCPATIERMENMSFRSNVYFVPKVVPYGFWDLDDNFTEKAIKKLATNAFSLIPDISFEPFNVVDLEAVLERNSLKSETHGVIFKLHSEYSAIKFTRTQETKVNKK
jgi:hypothetical protein